MTISLVRDRSRSEWTWFDHLVATSPVEPWLVAIASIPIGVCVLLLVLLRGWRRKTG